MKSPVRFRFFVALAVAAFVLGSSCHKHDDVIGGGTTGPRIVTLANANVIVNFRGLICHVLQTKYRAVALKPASGGYPPHMTRLIVPDSIDTTQLFNATGLKVSKFSADLVSMGPVDGFAIRVVDYDPQTAVVTEITPALDYSDPTFRDYVPHLLAASDNTMTKLRSEVFDATPDGTYAATFFELGGGKLTATPYCKKSKFKKDYENGGKKNPREFSEFVELSGIAPHTPILQFMKKGGSWENVQFISPVLPLKITLENIENPPRQVPISHFPEFFRLADPNLTVKKDEDVDPVVCPMKGAVPGCSDTAWP